MVASVGPEFPVSKQRLDPLLAPRSVCVVGASRQPNTPGNDCLQLLKRLGYDGNVFAVNPKYQEIDGTPCYGSMADAPPQPDTVILSVANERVEDALIEAINKGAKSAVIFGSCYLESDSESKLTERLAAIGREAGIPVCGGNCIGAFNLEKRYAATWFPLKDTYAGNIALIAHSGAIFVALMGLDFRLRYNVAVSAGQELVTTMADYLDYVLDLPSTRVAALFMETIRNPAGFESALQKARRKRIPVVSVKVGRTTLSAKLAESHSGAIAGNDAAYQALFDKYNVIRVDDADELAATALLLSTGKTIGSGGVAAITDSGGARGMLIDRASDLGLPMTKITPETQEILAEHLEYGLEPVNPVDIWGSGKDFERVYENCFTAITNDPGTSVGVSILDLSLDDYISDGFAKAIIATNDNTEKLVFVASNISRMPRDRLARHLSDQGIPVVDGASTALKALKRILTAKERGYRGFEHLPPGPDEVIRRKWMSRLGTGVTLGEAEAYRLFRDYSIPTIWHEEAGSTKAVEQAAAQIGFPVVLKTAREGVIHKTDVGGVRLGLASMPSLLTAYEEMAERLGPKVLVSEMLPKGHELAMGIVNDGQFGPLVMVGAGGLFVEILRDVKFGLVPFGIETAQTMISDLAISPMLDGVRGTPAIDKANLAEVLSRLSVLAHDLRDVLDEVDINPLICTGSSIIAVDGVVKGHALSTATP